jgi:hypothetical protein
MQELALKRDFPGLLKLYNSHIVRTSEIIIASVQPPGRPASARNTKIAS